MTNTEMPTTAQLNAVDHLCEAWVQARCSGFSDWLIWELRKLIHASIGELIGHFPGSRVDEIMDALEMGVPTRRAFESVLTPVGE